MDAIPDAAVPAIMAEPLRRTTARISVGMRLSLLVIALALAPLAAVAPVSWWWLGPALALLTGWTLIYRAVALRDGLIWWLVLADITLTVVACLSIRQLAPATQVMSGTSWVATMLTVCVVGVGFAWPLWLAVPAGLVMAASDVIGSRLAGAADASAAEGVVTAAKVISTAVVMILVRRARKAANAAFAEAQQAERAAALDEAHRADELRQLCLLHDTALATLTMVATSTIGGESAGLRARAAADLAALRGVAGDDPTRPVASEEPVRLDEQLAALGGQLVGKLSVRLTAAPCLVPAAVGEAFLGSVHEALTNVVRHARDRSADVVLRASKHRVVVTVTDRGGGFDPDAVPAHRYGIRSSIIARMAAVGGVAWLSSAPETGTAWTLEWNRA